MEVSTEVGKEAKERDKTFLSFEKNPPKTPPHDLEAEQAVLSGILYNNKVFHEISDISLHKEDFYKEAHQRIFAAIENIIGKGEPADVITVTAFLRSAGEIEKSGGRSYLAQISDISYSSSNVPHYAKIIKEKAILRKFVEVSVHLVNQAYSGVGEQESFLDEAEKEIFAITNERQTHNFNMLQDILLQNFDEIEENSRNVGSIAGLSSGFKSLDKKTNGWKPGQLIVVAARPGMGKTSFLLNLGINACLTKEKKCTVAFFSFEMSKEEIGMRILAMQSKVDSNLLRKGQASARDWQHLQRGAGTLSECPFLVDDTPALNVLEVKSRCRHIQSRYREQGPLGLVIIDYLQLMRGTRQSHNQNMNREQEISEISRGLKALAKELKIPVIAASQLNRSIEQRNDKRPFLSDLRESGAIEQDADMVLFIHRENMYNREEAEDAGEAEIIIGKQRSGPTGAINLSWVGRYTSFEDLSQEEGPPPI